MMDLETYANDIKQLQATADRRLQWLKDAMGWVEYCPECDGWLRPTIAGIYGHETDCRLAKELDDSRKDEHSR